jgi:hypothetical protein
MFGRFWAYIVGLGATRQSAIITVLGAIVCVLLAKWLDRGGDGLVVTGRLTLEAVQVDFAIPPVALLSEVAQQKLQEAKFFIAFDITNHGGTGIANAEIVFPDNVALDGVYAIQYFPSSIPKVEPIIGQRIAIANLPAAGKVTVNLWLRKQVSSTEELKLVAGVGVPTPFHLPPNRVYDYEPWYKYAFFAVLILFASSLIPWRRLLRRTHAAA